MTTRFPQALLLTLILSAAPNTSPAQAPTPSDSAGTRPTARATFAPLVRRLPAGIHPWTACVAPRGCGGSPEEVPLPDDVSEKRGRYAFIGFLVGAGVGAGLYLRACATEDCYGLYPAVLLGAAGGLLGMVVGLLLGPSPLGS